MKRFSAIAASHRPHTTASASPPLHVEIARQRAAVIPFPSFAPRHHVRELVRVMISVDVQRAENLLNRDLEVIAEDLLGAGADPVAVAQALRSFGGAVRVQ